MKKWILMLLVHCTILQNTFSQTSTFNTSHEEVGQTLNKALAEADKFIAYAMQPATMAKHLRLDTTICSVRNDTTFYFTSFIDHINFVPNKYQVVYQILIDGDTLTQLYIPLDSLGNVDIDTSATHYLWDDIKAYNRLLTGGYSFDYRKAKAFIKRKKLKKAHINFRNSISTMTSENYEKLLPFKHFWYISEYRRKKSRKGEKRLFEYTYKIDPDTGKVTFEKERIRFVA